jgi:hypothetical protein
VEKTIRPLGVYEGGNVTIEGQRWCFEGLHTLSIMKSDQRVTRSTELDIVLDGELQQKLDNLERDFPRVKKLTIRCRRNREEMRYSLEAALPKLKELKIDAILMSKLVLTSELTPLLEKLTLINLGDIDHCDFRVTAPLLRSITIHFMDVRSTEPINCMLAAAKNLRSFESYKLWSSVGSLKFTGNYLEKIVVRRSDCLRAIEVWSPRLTELNISASFDLTEVNILADHPLRAELTSDDAELPLSKFSVDVTNCCNNMALTSVLRANPRVARIIDETDRE